MLGSEPPLCCSFFLLIILTGLPVLSLLPPHPSSSHTHGGKAVSYLCIHI